MIRLSYSAVMLYLFLCAAIPAAADVGGNQSRCRAGMQDGICSLEARDTPLRLVLNALREECGVVISGLETRKSEIVTLPDLRGTPEYVVRQMLHVLKENNFLLQYEEDNLKKVAVLSASVASAAGAASETSAKRAANTKKGPGTPAEPPFPFVNRSPAVAVRGIVAQSQAEELGLKKGDIILEYDGVKIESASQLINKVKEKSPEETVEMLVVRDGRTERYRVKGGQIGVQIHTIIVPIEKLEGVASGGASKTPAPAPPVLKTF